MIISKLLTAASAAICLALSGSALGQTSNAGVLNPVLDSFEADTVRSIIAQDPDLTILNEGMLTETSRSYFFMLHYKKIPVMVTIICGESGTCGNALFYANYGSAVSSGDVNVNLSNRSSLFGWHVAEISGRVGFKHVMLAKGVTGESVRTNIKLFAAAYVLSYDRLKRSANTIAYTPRDNAGVDADHLPEIDFTRTDITALLSQSFAADFNVEGFLNDPQNTGEVRKVLNNYLTGAQLP